MEQTILPSFLLMHSARPALICMQELSARFCQSPAMGRHGVMLEPILAHTLIYFGEISGSTM